MEDKLKMTQVLANCGVHFQFRHELANALIDAGYGDVAANRSKIGRLEQEIDKLMIYPKIAAKKLYARDCEIFDLKMENAEKDKRIAVLERALRNYLVRKDNDETGDVTCFEMGYGWTCPHRETGKPCVDCRYEYIIKQAEQELAEEES